MLLLLRITDDSSLIPGSGELKRKLMTSRGEEEEALSVVERRRVSLLGIHQAIRGGPVAVRGL